MDAGGNLLEDGLGGTRRSWGSSGMATLTPLPKAEPPSGVSPEGRPYAGPRQNDVVLCDSVSDDIFPIALGQCLPNTNGPGW